MTTAAELHLHGLESGALLAGAEPSPFLGQARPLAGCVRAGRPWEPPADCLADPEDALFAEALAVATNPEAPDSLVRLSACGRAFDFLGDPAWNALDWEIADPRRRILHSVRAAVRDLRPAPPAPPLIVTSIRNEAPRLLDWIAYHRAIGLGDILIYSNNNTDGSDALLYALASRGTITWVDNDVGPEVSPQIKAFEHALLFGAATLGARRAAFIDADEYLVLGEAGEDAAEAVEAMFAARPGNAPVGAVALHWRWFTHDGCFETRPGLAAEQYTRARTDLHVKCLVDLSATFSMRKVHVPVFGPGEWAMMDAEGDRYDERRGIKGRTLKAGQVNHYWSTSFLDYALKKQRGRGAVGQDGEQRVYAQFFDWGSPRHCPDIDLRIQPRLAALAAEREALLADNAVRRAQREAAAIHAETMARLAADEGLRGIYLEGCARSGVAPHIDGAARAA